MNVPRALSLFPLVSIGAFALCLVGCSSAPSAAEDVAESENDLALYRAVSVVRLPEGDPCRPVLAPLALGLGTGAVGRRNLVSAKVIPIAETFERVYRVDIHGKALVVDGKTIANDYSFDLTLDNDSHSLCYIVAASFGSTAIDDFTAKLSSASNDELNFPVGAVSVPTDTCAGTTQLLGRAAATSIGYGATLSTTSVNLDLAAVERNYSVHVNGENFVANGHVFENDHEFSIKLDNDSASLCMPLALSFH